MCLAVPVQITEVQESGMLRCRVGDSDTYINASAMLLSEDLHPGDYVIVHAGFALRKVEPKDAEETISLLREMVALACPVER